jgi:Zn-dependent protease
LARYMADPDVEEAIEGIFNIRDMYFYMDQPTYVVEPIEEGDPKMLMKVGFKRLVDELRPLGFLPRLNKEIDRYLITLFKAPPPSPSRMNRNVILFAVTTCTIFLDGFIRSNNPLLVDILMPNTPVYVNALYFTLAILAIFGLHELGHKAVAVLRGVEASMPYFIPAPPGMGGTFGAVITQKEPPANRDALFDLGLSGPLAGFIVTVLVAVVGLRLSFVVPIEEVHSWMFNYPEIRFQSIPFPILLVFLQSIIRPAQEGMVLLIHPVGFAAWVGCLVTFINLIPAWQLDGGHISRAIFGKYYHKLMSIIGVAVMFLTGYIVMAIITFFLMMRTQGDAEAPLDDVSPLSPSRKALIFVYLAIVLLTLVTLFPS